MPSFMNCTEVCGLSSRLTPPTTAASHWPWRMAWKAFSRASKLEEQAVSMAVLGPGGGEERRGGWIRARNHIYRKGYPGILEELESIQIVHVSAMAKQSSKLNVITANA